MINQQSNLARRRFLSSGVLNLSALATAWLLQQEQVRAEPKKPDLDRAAFNLRPKPTHRPPRATAMISMFMQGGPSQMDLLDPKPELNRLDGQKFPGTIKYDNAAQASSTVLGSPWKFSKHGESGTDISELLPHTAQRMHLLSLVRSVNTKINDHGQGMRFMEKGRRAGEYPYIGSTASAQRVESRPGNRG
jgi:hypothetical protein